MINFLLKVRLEEYPRLERFLTVLSLVVIAVNFITCLIVLKARENDFIKDQVATKEVTKKDMCSPVSKSQHMADSTKKETLH